MADTTTPAVTGWGFQDMPAEQYHADPCPRPSLSSGLLATIINETVAAAHYSHPRLGKPLDQEEVDNKKFDVGTVGHTIVLGKGRNVDVIDAANWVAKAAKEQREASKAAGNSPILKHQFEEIQEMKTALFEQLADIPGEEDTFSPEHGIAEQAGFAQVQTGAGKLWGRALYDWRRTDRLVVRDYKTFRGQQGADPDGFVKGLVGQGKDIQDPWYSMIYALIHAAETGEDITWRDVDFKFVVQDPRPPYLVSVVSLMDREWSGRRMEWAIDRWVAAARANLWRGFTPTVHHVPPPTWAKVQFEERMAREFEGEQEMIREGRPALLLEEPAKYLADDEGDIEAK